MVAQSQLLSPAEDEFFTKIVARPNWVDFADLTSGVIRNLRQLPITGFFQPSRTEPAVHRNTRIRRGKNLEIVKIGILEYAPRLKPQVISIYHGGISWIRAQIVGFLRVRRQIVEFRVATIEIIDVLEVAIDESKYKVAVPAEEISPLSALRI